MEEQKLTVDELNLINSIKTEYSHKIEEFGNLKMNKIIVKQQWDNLNSQEDILEKEVIEIQNKEKEIYKTIEKKYGVGTLNLQTGIFTKELSK